MLRMNELAKNSLLRIEFYLPARPVARRYLEIAVSMFGSNDDKKTPAAAGEKKGLFGWLRKSRRKPSSNSHRFTLNRPLNP